MLTVPEAARRVGRNPETVRRWIREGRLAAHKVGTQHVIEERDLDALDPAARRSALPPAWRRTVTSEPMPDVVDSVRRSRGRATRGMTRGMKVAVSVPNDLFERADRLARATGRSRSDVYSSALREYVGRHAPDEITAALDRVVGELNDPIDPFVEAAGRRVLEATNW